MATFTFAASSPHYKGSPETRLLTLRPLKRKNKASELTELDQECTANNFTTRM